MDVREIQKTENITERNLRSDEVEKLLCKALGIPEFANTRFDWDVSENCLDGVRIVTTIENIEEQKPVLTKI